jgi:hypothetical protein
MYGQCVPERHLAVGSHHLAQAIDKLHANPSAIHSRQAKASIRVRNAIVDNATDLTGCGLYAHSIGPSVESSRDVPSKIFASFRQPEKHMRNDRLIRLDPLPPFLRGLPELLGREIGAQLERDRQQHLGRTEVQAQDLFDAADPCFSHTVSEGEFGQ